MIDKAFFYRAVSDHSALMSHVESKLDSSIYQTRFMPLTRREARSGSIPDIYPRSLMGKYAKTVVTSPVRLTTSA